MDETFLTTTEVIEYLQVNLRTVYRLLKAGELPGVRVGRQWRFRKSDVDAWLEGQRTGRRATPPRSAAGDDRAPAAASKPAGTTEVRVSAPRILVADDEESIRELLASTLALADYEVQTVADGQAALDRLRAEPFDLLITDLRMPRLDGLGMLRQARRLHPRLAVVIITGYPSETSAIEAVNLGVSGYLTKPFKIAKVLAVAAHALGEDI
jgi:excisionase family DNA binding protein